MTRVAAGRVTLQMETPTNRSAILAPLDPEDVRKRLRNLRTHLDLTQKALGSDYLAIQRVMTETSVKIEEAKAELHKSIASIRAKQQHQSHAAGLYEHEDFLAITFDSEQGERQVLDSATLLATDLQLSLRKLSRDKAKAAAEQGEPIQMSRGVHDVKPSATMGTSHPTTNKSRTNNSHSTIGRGVPQYDDGKVQVLT